MIYETVKLFQFFKSKKLNCMEVYSPGQSSTVLFPDPGRDDGIKKLGSCRFVLVRGIQIVFARHSSSCGEWVVDVEDIKNNLK